MTNLKIFKDIAQITAYQGQSYFWPVSSYCFAYKGVFKCNRCFCTCEIKYSHEKVNFSRMNSDLTWERISPMYCGTPVSAPSFNV